MQLHTVLDAAYGRMSVATKNLEKFIASQSQDHRLRKQLLDELIAANATYVSLMDRRIAEALQDDRSKSA
jgi:hypothetical protein